MHRSTSVMLKSVVKCAQRTRFVELREINLLGKICDRPIPDLRRVPAMPRIASIRYKQNSTFVKMML